MRLLLSFIPVSLMAGMTLPGKVDTSLGHFVKYARLTTCGEAGSRGSGKLLHHQTKEAGAEVARNLPRVSLVVPPTDACTNGFRIPYCEVVM